MIIMVILMNYDYNKIVNFLFGKEIKALNSVIEEVISARSSEVQRDEVYERLINKGEYRVSKENLVVDTEPEKENKVEEVTIQSL